VRSRSPATERTFTCCSWDAMGPHVACNFARTPSACFARAGAVPSVEPTTELVPKSVAGIDLGATSRSTTEGLRAQTRDALPAGCNGERP